MGLLYRFIFKEFRPIVYWLMNVGTTIVGTIRAIRKKRGQRAVWVTVDRGLREK